jgi:DNA mismatch repair protein MutS
MAGMPNAIVLRANEIMSHLEKSHAGQETKQKMKEVPKNNYQLNFFEALHPHLNQAQTMIKELDINAMSPVEALLKLNELKKLLEN